MIYEKKTVFKERILIRKIFTLRIHSMPCMTYMIKKVYLFSPIVIIYTRSITFSNYPLGDNLSNPKQRSQKTSKIHMLQCYMVIHSGINIEYWSWPCCPKIIIFYPHLIILQKAYISLFSAIYSLFHLFFYWIQFGELHQIQIVYNHSKTHLQTIEYCHGY